MAKYFNVSKRTRLKATIYVDAFFGVIAIFCLVAMYRKPELDFTGIVTTCIAGIITVTTAYTAGESIRKSNGEG